MMEVTKMIEYRPWSQAVLEESLNSYKQGGFNILDIELGGAGKTSVEHLNCVI